MKANNCATLCAEMAGKNDSGKTFVIRRGFIILVGIFVNDFISKSLQYYYLKLDFKASEGLFVMYLKK